MDIWDRPDLEKAESLDKNFYVYFFTPMCGACQFASQLIEIIEQSDDWRQPLAKMDLNFVPEVAERLQITSVPALVFFEHGKAKRISYELGNVSSIYDFFQK